MSRTVTVVRLSLVVALLFIVPFTSINAGGYGRTATFYSDNTFTCIVGQKHYPEIGCENDSYQEWGITSNFRHTQWYDMCGQPAFDNCEEKIDGVWTHVDCPWW